MSRIPSAEMRTFLSELGAGTLDRCMHCGLCTALCPWRLVPGETSRAFNIRIMQRLAQLGLEGFESEETLFACTTCGLCRDNCPRGVEIIENVRAMRSTLVSMGSVPRHLGPILASTHASGNPWSGPREKRTAWTEGLDVPSFGPDTEYFLFVCCHSCYDPAGIRVARSIATLLKRAGVSFGIIGTNESCCGESIRKLGDDALFERLAGANVRLFNERKVHRIITTSPHCLWTFRNEYPAFGGRYEVLHYTEVLAEAVAEGRLALHTESGKRVAFHDPCYLGRQSGIYDAPRSLLEAAGGFEVVPLRNERRLSLCCAGGGGRIWAEVPKGERFGELRVREAAESGAEVLASACPYCVAMLSDACRGLKMEGLEVKELSEVLAEIS